MKIRTIITVSVLLCLQLNSYALPSIERGKEIFTSRCSSCHNINKDLTGPGLAGVDQRRTIEWIISFIQSPQLKIKNGDPYAVALFNKFNNVTMPDHLDLVATDIKGIVEYIKAESKLAVVKPPFSTPGKLKPAYTPLSITANYGFFISFLCIVFVMIGVMLLAVEVKSIERKKVDAVKGM